MDLIFRKDNEKLFLQRWQEYIDNNLASHVYLTIQFKYTPYDYENLYADFSFVAVQNNKPVAICLLPIENINNCNTITSAGEYLPSPLAINEKIEGKIYQYIEEIARQNNVKVVKFYLDSLLMEYKNKVNDLLKYDYIDSSSTNGILDLNKDIEELWSNLRKGHKWLIRKIQKDNNVKIIKIDRTNADYDVHESYRELHHKCSGRMTRSKETFDEQFEMLKNDFASLFGLRYKDKHIGFCYLFHYKKIVTYASASDDPDYDQYPISHAIIWEAIKYYKERSFDFMRFTRPYGYSMVSGFNNYQDQKQINISLFKRGFGARMVPLFRGIKYFDRNMFIEDLEQFKNKTLEVL